MNRNEKKSVRCFLGLLTMLFLLLTVNVVTELPTFVRNDTVTVQKKNKKKNKNKKKETQAAQTEKKETEETEREEVVYTFRNQKLLDQHFEKHGAEFDEYETAEEYEAGASAVVNNPDALHKTEKEDGDDVYYVEETNEFVIVSQDGYIRTYFKPSAGIKYYNRQ